MLEKFKDYERVVTKQGELRSDATVRVKRDAEAFLILKYPKYGAEIKKSHLWYAHWYPIRLARAGCRAMDIDPLDLDNFTIAWDDKYWEPGIRLDEQTSKAILTHMRSTARQSIHVLNKEKLKRNLGWPFPVGYDDVLADKEIEDTVRVLSFDVDRKKIFLQKACYLDQVATNINPDELIANTGLGEVTFRNLDSSEDALCPFSSCMQANTIGVAAAFADNQGNILMRQRKKQQSEGVQTDMAVMKEGIHCASSGVLRWQDLYNAEGNINEESIKEGIIRGMIREIFRETGIKGDGVGSELKYKIAPIAFARELPRAGKPQFFFLVVFDCSMATLMKEIENKRDSADPPIEWDEYGDNIVCLDRKELFRNIDDRVAFRYTYEGWATSYAARAYYLSRDDKEDAISFRLAADFWK